MLRGSFPPLFSPAVCFTRRAHVLLGDAATSNERVHGAEPPPDEARNQCASLNRQQVAPSPSAETHTSKRGLSLSSHRFQHLFACRNTRRAASRVSAWL